MKKLLLVLVLFPGILYSQNKRVSNNLLEGQFFVKLEVPRGTSVCGEDLVKFYISSKYIYIQTYSLKYDLKVTKRRKGEWIAKDNCNNTYHIFGTTFEGNSMLIIDPDELEEPVFIMSTVNPCK